MLVHVATPVEYVEGDEAGEWIEGEPGAEGPTPEKGVAFSCVLFLPIGTEDEGQPRRRKVTRPTILFEPEDVNGGAMDPPSADHELLIAAPELAASFEQAAGEPPGTGRWQIEGTPQPFGPPGSVLGYQATVTQVEQ